MGDTSKPAPTGRHDDMEQYDHLAAEITLQRMLNAMRGARGEKARADACHRILVEEFRERRAALATPPPVEVSLPGLLTPEGASLAARCAKAWREASDDVRSYVAALETEADPAGTIREVVLLRDTVATLSAALAEARSLSASPSHGDAREGGLTFHDAVRIARGCTDYGGGYRDNGKHFGIYQHGITTVVAALESAEAKGLDSQTAALHAIGPLAPPPPPKEDA